MLYPNLPILVLQDGTPTPITSVSPAPSTTASEGAPAPNGTTEPKPPGMMSWLPFVVIFAVVWFMMINPERKNRKKREAMISALKKGDRVLSASGIYGTVIQIQDQVVTLQIAENVRIRMNLGSVQQLESEATEANEKAKA